MTENEWHRSYNADSLLDFLGDRAAGRRLRLAASACCRLIWDLLTDPRLRDAVETAERFADGRASAAELAAAHQAAEAAHLDIIFAGHPAPVCGYAVSAVTSQSHVGTTLGSVCGSISAARKDGLHLRLAPLVRDIFGNPFRPVAFDSSWRTPTATTLAAQMYDSRDFTPMPILADVLQDAECDHADVLDHCRGPGPHVRGCWVADLVLGKE